MRLSRGFAALLGIGIVGPALFVGCFAPADDCLLAFDCPRGTLDTSSSSSGGGGGPVTDPSCVPSTAKGPVGDTCGVFVAAATGADTNAGSKGAPVATLGKAIELAKAGSRRIYACAETFTGALIVPAGVEIYGGLDCMTGWSWLDTARTTVTAGADEVPLKLSAGVEGTTRLENVNVTAVDAAAPGGSSIAAIIDNVPAELTRCDFVAGKGVAGADGQVPMATPDSGVAGAPGSNTCDPPAGGLGGVLTCDVGMSAGGDGGKGGSGIDVNGGAGDSGANGEPAAAVTGAGGPGAANIPNAVCSAGGNGRDGDPGMSGLGGTTLGTISIAGYAGTDGQDGGTGQPGQGGGGGGGYKFGGLNCGMPLMDGPGASGGGGGSGGCGGKGGSSGKAGGSSIGVISLNATLSMKQVTITTGDSGKGGAGSAGQSGGTGGLGAVGGAKSNAVGSKPGCKGGDGGLGGDGGPSGGGHGGHSIGVAYTGMTAPALDSVMVTVGAPGEGGLGASGDPSGDGASGMASKDAVQFPAP